MGLLARIFGAIPGAEMNGIRLDTTRPLWEVSGKTDFPSLFAALPELLPEGCVLYFEDGSPTGEIAAFLREHQIPERTHVAYGTIWPKPATYHVLATAVTLNRLADLSRSLAYPELAIHFHVYREQTVLLEWHDAFTQPMLISADLSERQISAFAERLQMSYKQCRVE